MQILKTTVDRSPTPVVEFHGQEGEEIRVWLGARSPDDDDETLIELAKTMMSQAVAAEPSFESSGEPGTDEQRPRWEGPPENRPGGYLPAIDDPERERDAAGETLADPAKRRLSDALTTRNSERE